MSAIDPAAARQFAVDVVRRLRDEGHQALWAGGCVRDQLMGLEPNDYDVATSAEPNEIRRVFGRRRTLAIGAAFGVITVLGPSGSGPIEVATFRQDAPYSDGRRPDAVSYSTAEEDAKRRDFTINGLFYDPIADRTIDYVGGEEDLRRQLIRAIGSPDARIAEDKLRMLRAVRFAATLQFAIDAETLAAVQRHAADIRVVSAERIGAEMRRLFRRHAASGMRLLRDGRLLPEIAAPLADDAVDWDTMIASLQRLDEGPFPVALAVAVWHAAEPRQAAAQLTRQWRLSNAEAKQVKWLLESLPIVLSAREQPWPVLQRLLAADAGHQWQGLAAAEAVAAGRGDDLSAVEYCRQRTSGDRRQWDPPPLIDGNDLVRAGLRPGRDFQRLLTAVRDQQLEGRLTSPDEALECAKQMLEEP